MFRAVAKGTLCSNSPFRPHRIAILRRHRALPHQIADSGLHSGRFLPRIAATSSPAPANPPANASNPAPAQQKLPSVTTTVIVHGETKDDYLPEAVTVGTLDGATLQQAPLSATVVTRDLLTDQVSRLLSDVVKNDASIGEDYAPVGYYGDFEIRGFPIDLATGLEIDGMTIAGEQDVPLENKQSVEFLKGIAGVESGVASAGGLIDYVTKRPAAIEAIDLATDHRGTVYGAVDLGRLFGSRKQVGARVNLAGEKIRATSTTPTAGAPWALARPTGSSAPGRSSRATSNISTRSSARSAAISCSAAQPCPISASVYPSTMLGEQSWAKPNTFDAFNTGTRLDYDLPTTGAPSPPPASAIRSSTTT